MKHEVIEKNVGLMALLMVFAVSIGGLTQIVPLFFQDVTNKPVEGMKPYTALQLEGRDIYIREGCVGCHSQMIRPFRAETERYGHYSVAGESVWDHPFLWGSKRTGPDLARVGGRYSDDWHRAHLYNPRNVVPESKMPSYPWLVAAVDSSHTDVKLRTCAPSACRTPTTTSPAPATRSRARPRWTRWSPTCRCLAPRSRTRGECDGNGHRHDPWPGHPGGDDRLHRPVALGVQPSRDRDFAEARLLPFVDDRLPPAGQEPAMRSNGQ
jgi:cytochrome c oxidase cbb3-type subunit 2